MQGEVLVSEGEDKGLTADEWRSATVDPPERPRPTTIAQAVEVLIFCVEDHSRWTQQVDTEEEWLADSRREASAALRRCTLARRDLLDLADAHADECVRSAAQAWDAASKRNVLDAQPIAIFQPAAESVASPAPPGVPSAPFVGPLGPTLCSLTSCREPTDGRRDGFDAPKCASHGGLNRAQREQLATERAEWERQERVLDRDA